MFRRLHNGDRHASNTAILVFERTGTVLIFPCGSILTHVPSVL